jgi:hypothetical protein
MTLDDFVTRFTTEERAVGNLLNPEQIQAQAVAAASFYAGYGHIEAESPASTDPVTAPLAPVASIGLDTVISLSEWALIRPLFLLYVEREEARLIESSRIMGADLGYGRASPEIAAEIQQIEAEMSKEAFCQPVITV